MRKLLIFLMITIPLVVIFIVNITVDAVAGIVIVPVDKVSIYYDGEYEEEGDILSIKVDDIHKTIKLLPKIYPESASNKLVYWESANPDIAVVDSYGNVSFVGFGKTQIYLANSDGTKRTSCYVDVTDTKVHNISIVVDETVLEIGSTTVIRAAVSPSTALDNTYTLTSSNPDVLTINEAGEATAISAGEVTIIATANDKSIGYTCTSSLIIKVVKSVENIQLYPEEENLILATNEIRLRAIITPADASNKNVFYTCTDPLTASVTNDGVVKFFKAGSVVITVITEDGKHRDSINLTYTGGYPIKLTIDNIENNEIEVDVSQGPCYTQIRHSFSPENPPIQNIEFVSSNTDVATVDKNGLIKVFGGGNAIITVKAQSRNTANGNTPMLIETIAITAKRKIDRITFENDSVITASESYQIIPIPFPLDATDLDNLIYEIISGDCATISAKGNLIFTKAGQVVVKITDNSSLQTESVSSTIIVRYTGGYPDDIILESHIELNVESFKYIDSIFNVFPTDASIRNYFFEIKESNPIYGSSPVISLDESGRIDGLSGGSAVVLIHIQISDDEWITKECEVIINQQIAKIEIECEEEVYEDHFISSKNIFDFSVNLLPLDLTNTEIAYELSNTNIATLINGSQIYFNQVGTLTLTVYSVENPNVKAVANFWYTGGCSINATVNGLPQTIINGDSPFDITLSGIVPKNSENSSFRVEFGNTDMFSVSYNTNRTKATVETLNSGSTMLSILITNADGSHTTLFTQHITVLQKADYIAFPYDSQMISSMQFNLQCEISPASASQREIVYSLSSEDQHLATINGSILTFKPSSNPSETVTVFAKLIDIDGSEKTAQFEITSTLGKITSPEGNQITLATGSSIEYDFSSEISESTKLNIVSSSENVYYDINDNRLNIFAVSPGFAEIRVEKWNKSTNELIEVIDNIEITIIVSIEDISIESVELSKIGNKFATAQNNIELTISLFPQESSEEGLMFIVSDSTIASFDSESNVLHFNKEGTIDLTIISADGSCSRSFTIQYTDGKALSYSLNIENAQNVYVSQNYSVEIISSSLIPANAQLFVININEIVPSGSVAGISVYNAENGKVIEFIRSGSIKLNIQMADGSEKIISLNVKSSLSEIIFNKSNIVTISDTVQLEPLLLPTSATDKSIIYSVDNLSIASVSDTGLVFFVKSGTVVITVRSASNEEIFATCTVTSTLGDIAEFTLNHTNLTMSVGESRDLRVSYIPINATNLDFVYEIISSIAGDGSSNPVISINGNTVKCLTGGTATVRVYIINQNGETLSQTCSIISVRELTSISISFDREIDTYQNYFITSLTELNLTINLFPTDATILTKSMTVDNNSVAIIEGGRLIFIDEGTVTITATVNSGSRTIIEKITIRHTKSAVSFELDDDNIQIINGLANVSISVGDYYIVQVKNIIPFDLANQTVILTLYKNSANYNNHNVSYASGSSIHGENGGTSEYEIKVCGLTLNQKLKINVIRLAESIASESEIITPNSSYPLSAYVLPYDTSDSSLVYSIINPSSGVSINQYGIVSFTTETTATVKIENIASGLSKTVTITYDMGAKEIIFENRQPYVFIGGTLQLLTRIIPHASQNEPIFWSVSNSSLASISNTGLFTPKQSEGEVTVTARLENYPETVATIKINIYAIVHSIFFDLKNSEDSDRGIAGTRVFGTYSVKGSNLYLSDGGLDVYTSLTNQRTIVPKVTYNGNSIPNLIWTSSNPSIATVENGVITILKAGVVKISCRPAKQYFSENPSNPQFMEASYEFTFIDAINIETASNFGAWTQMNLDIDSYKQAFNPLLELDSQGRHPTLSAEDITNMLLSHKLFLLPAVLQKDISLGYESSGVFKDLYGNGYMLNLQFNSKPNARPIQITGDTTVNNVYFRGYTFSGGDKTLTKLQDMSSVVEIRNTNNTVRTVTLKNCIIDGGSNCLDIRNSTVNLSGCILQNAYYGLIVIDTDDNIYPPTELNLKNCILENGMLGCILNVADKNSNSANPKITFNGKVYMFNWQDVSLYEGFSIKDYSMFDSVLADQVRQLFNEVGDKLMTTNGKTYIHLGVLSPSINLNYLGFSFKLEFQCSLIDNSTIFYTENRIIKDIVGIGKYNVIMYGLDANHSREIPPGSSYTKNSLNYYREIRDLT